MDLIIVSTLLLSAILMPFLLQAAVLFWAGKLLKIPGFSYKSSLKITFFYIVAQIILIIVLLIGVTTLLAISPPPIDPEFIRPLLAIPLLPILFFVLHYFLRKYPKSTWKKSIGIFLIYTISSMVISYAANFLMVKPIRNFIMSPFYIEGPTMSPTLNSHDYVLIKKWEKLYTRGDIIVFRYLDKGKYPAMNGSFLIKRIIGLPGEKVAIQNGSVFINDSVLEEPYIKIQTPGTTLLVLGKDEYFVLGDNRSKSLDSRFYGPIASTDIEGKVFFTIHNSRQKFVTPS